MLASPQFLYLHEPTGEDRQLSDWQIASRLSYFLWSSMPDEELLDLAEAGRLHEASVLAEQVDRMLDDSRARALVESWRQRDSA